MQENQIPISQPETLQGQSEVDPTTQKGFPWLKLAGFVFVFLAVINLGLFYYLSQQNKSKLLDEQVGTEDSQGFLLTKPDQSISREGYSITFLNPRYEHLEGQSNFKVDITLSNESIEPGVKVIANCDISENGQIVKEGAGVSVESGEAGEILPGNSSNWTALVILDNKDQKISSCIYAPEGIFDPKQTIRVVF